MAKRGIRHYEGDLSPKGEWQMMEERFELDDVEWVILHKVYQDKYLNVKVAADGQAPNKANYWLSWKIADGKPAIAKHLILMKDNRPPLYDFVESKIAELIAKLRPLAA